MKKVTIVTPVYKVEKYIADCVQSVVEQTYPCIEFILIDDHGGDRSIEIAKEMLSKVKRDGFTYHIIDYGCNKGVSVARNEAMKAATGDYIFCLDSDDKLNNDCIEKLVRRAEETGADVVICGHYSDEGREKFAGHLSVVKMYLENNLEILKAYSESMYNVTPWCKLLNLGFVKKNNLYFEPNIINEDAPWTFLLSLSANTIAFVKEDLYYYRQNSQSIMSNSKKEIVNNAGHYTLDLMCSTIPCKSDYVNNLSLYRIWMRQLIIFYTRVESSYPFGFFSNEVDCLIKWQIKFAGNVVSQGPIYYKLWYKVFAMPHFFRPLYLYLLINLHKIR